jgi:hypothetical protein
VHHLNQGGKCRIGERKKHSKRGGEENGSLGGALLKVKPKEKGKGRLQTCLQIQTQQRAQTSVEE